MNDSSPDFLPILGFAQDAYDYGTRIMGRQSYGRGFIRALMQSRFDQVKLVPLQSSDTGNLTDFIDTLGDSRFIQTTMESLFTPTGGTLFFPGLAPRSLAVKRRDYSGASFSIVSITHSLSTANAFNLMQDLLMSPFKSSDGLLQTSEAARVFVDDLERSIGAMQDHSSAGSGPPTITRSLIPLSVDDSIIKLEWDKSLERAALGISTDDFVILAPGRQSFHAKANPFSLYKALSKVKTQRKIVLVQAGKFPNSHIREAFISAANSICPNVKLVELSAEEEYDRGWRIADVMVSLADNIQETFGLTLVEALAYGLPCIVSDWSGYRDIVRPNVNGFLIPTLFPAKDEELSDSILKRYLNDQDTYDLYIGRLSCACSVDFEVLISALSELINDEEKRLTYSKRARESARSFTWSQALEKYQEFAMHLTYKREVERVGNRGMARTKPYINYFSHFPSSSDLRSYNFILRENADDEFNQVKDLTIANYVFHDSTFHSVSIRQFISRLKANKKYSFDDLDALNTDGHLAEKVMWLIKFGVLRVSPK